MINPDKIESSRCEVISIEGDVITVKIKNQLFTGWTDRIEFKNKYYKEIKQRIKIGDHYKGTFTFSILAGDKYYLRSLTEL